MRRRHAGEEDSGFIRIHIPFHPSFHTFQCHTISILCGYIYYVLHFIFKRTLPAKKNKNNTHCIIFFLLGDQVRKEFRYTDLQNLEGETSHPPNISIEHQNISTFPVFTMLNYGPFTYNSISYSVYNSIVRI